MLPKLGKQSFSYLIDPTFSFYEFIPFNENNNNECKTVALNEVENDKKYEMVLTNLSGLYRYKTGDIIKIIKNNESEIFVEFCNNILDVCNKTYKQLDHMFDGDFDPMDILHIENEIAKSCDDWFRWLKLDIKYEPGCGTEEELYFKIGILESWLERKEIPKEVPVF